MSLTLENAAVAQRDFDTLNAAAFIHEIRRPVDAVSTDMDAVIAALEGRVRYAPIPTSGMLGRVWPPSVWIRRDDPVCRQEITKGHELGHAFLLVRADPTIQVSWGEPALRVSLDDPRKSAIEAFCDIFAHRLIGVPPCLVPQTE